MTYITLYCIYKPSSVFISSLTVRTYLKYLQDDILASTIIFVFSVIK